MQTEVVRIEEVKPGKDGGYREGCADSGCRNNSYKKLLIGNGNMVRVEVFCYQHWVEFLKTVCGDFAKDQLIK